MILRSCRLLLLFGVLACSAPPIPSISLESPAPTIPTENALGIGSTGEIVAPWMGPQRRAHRQLGYNPDGGAGSGDWYDGGS